VYCRSTLPPFTMGVLDVCSPGVVTGEKLYALLKYAQEKKFAIPSVNCTSSSTINAALECARDVKSPIMIQFSNGGGAFYAGKGLSNEGQKASILGSVAGALHVRAMAEHYGVPVVLHSDHCAKKLLPWLDGTLMSRFHDETMGGGGLVRCRCLQECGELCWDCLVPVLPSAAPVDAVASDLVGWLLTRLLCSTDIWGACFVGHACADDIGCPTQACSRPMRSTSRSTASPCSAPTWYAVLFQCSCTILAFLPLPQAVC